MTKGSVVENASAIADFEVYCSLDNGSETVPYFLNLEATQENGINTTENNERGDAA